MGVPRRAHGGSVLCSATRLRCVEEPPGTAHGPTGASPSMPAADSPTHGARRRCHGPDCQDSPAPPSRSPQAADGAVCPEISTEMFTGAGITLPAQDRGEGCLAWFTFINLHIRRSMYFVPNLKQRSGSHSGPSGSVWRPSSGCKRACRVPL